VDAGHRQAGDEEKDAVTPRPFYRVDRAVLAGDIWILALFALDLAFGLAVRHRLPERVPTHWGADGQVNGWGSPWEAVLLPPAIAAGAYLILLFAPLIDPRRASYSFFGETLRFIRGALVVFVLGIHVLTLLGPLGVPISMDRVARLGVPLLFVALGNIWGRVRPNWFFGIRVPWTLDSEEVWTRTHRMAGKLWVAGGLLLLPAAFLPAGAGSVVLSSVLGALVVAPIVYSYVIYRRLGAR
jgi:uncharacterized membrane protein